MTTNEITRKVKDTLVWIAVGALISLIPFYYQTKANIDANYKNSNNNAVELKENKHQLIEVKNSQIVHEERQVQILKRLEKIENKIDYLIEHNE